MHCSAAAWLTVNDCPAIVRVPLLAAPLEGATLNVTSPAPLAEAPDSIWIHGTPLVAVQLHPAPATIDTLPEPPAAGSVWLVDDSAYEQVLAAGWLTVNVVPATAIVPVRADPVEAATENSSSPFPLPDAPATIWIQGTVDVAVHEHPAAAAIAIFPVPPSAGIAVLSGAMRKAHACDWDTVTVWPATVTVAVLGAPLVGATDSVTVPVPASVAGPLTVIHGTPLEADHGHPAAEATRTATVPPAAPTAYATGSTS